MEQAEKTLEQKLMGAHNLVDEFLFVPVEKVFWKASIRTFTKDDVMNMGMSLRVHGQVMPIVCKPADQEGRFEGVVGRLRFEGAKHASLKIILIRIHKFKDEAEVLEMQLVENLHRKTMSALEKTGAYGKLAELRRKRFKEESVIAGISMSIEGLTGVKPAERTVREYLEIDRKLGNKAKRSGAQSPSKKVGIRHLKQISRVSDEHKQAELLTHTIHGNWTVHKLRREVNKTLGISPTPPEPVLTNLTLECPICQSRYVLVHMAHGKHSLRRVTDQLALALTQTRQALTGRQFNLMGFTDVMEQFGARDVEAIEKLFWQKVQEKQIRSVGGGSFRYA